MLNLFLAVSILTPCANPDTVDFWRVFLNDSLVVQSVNAGPNVPRQIFTLDVPADRISDSLIVQYCTDTPPVNAALVFRDDDADKDIAVSKTVRQKGMCTENVLMLTDLQIHTDGQDDHVRKILALMQWKSGYEYILFRLVLH